MLDNPENMVRAKEGCSNDKRCIGIERVEGIHIKHCFDFIYTTTGEGEIITEVDNITQHYKKEKRYGKFGAIWFGIGLHI